MVVLTDKTVMVVKLYVSDSELRSQYLDRCAEHNESIDTDHYYNAGFDLLTPRTTEFEPGKMTLLDMGIKTAAYWMDENDDLVAPTAYDVRPRSSICKSPLRLANSMGLIDAGYRGVLKSAFDCIGTEVYTLEKFTRIVQLVSPIKGRVKVVVVQNESDLGETLRGEGGFGSTGQ